MAQRNRPTRIPPIVHECIKTRPRDGADPVIVHSLGLSDEGHTENSGRGDVLRVGVGGTVVEEEIVDVEG